MQTIADSNISQSISFLHIFARIGGSTGVGESDGFSVAGKLSEVCSPLDR